MRSLTTLFLISKALSPSTPFHILPCMLPCTRHANRQVLTLLGELEARLDFDEDLPPLDLEGLKKDIEALQVRVFA